MLPTRQLQCYHSSFHVHLYVSPVAADLINQQGNQQTDQNLVIDSPPDGARSSTSNDPVTAPDHFVRMLELTNANNSGYLLDMSTGSSVANVNQSQTPPLASSTLAPVRVVIHLEANDEKV